MSTQIPSLPEELRSTVEMLRLAYPHGVPAEEFDLLAYFLCTIGGMSVRNVATAIAELNKVHYATLLHPIDKIVNELVEPHYDSAEVDRIRNKLRPHGLDQWLAERE
jgi:hypothetical protein